MQLNNIIKRIFYYLAFLFRNKKAKRMSLIKTINFLKKCTYKIIINEILYLI